MPSLGWPTVSSSDAPWHEGRKADAMVKLSEHGLEGTWLKNELCGSLLGHVGLSGRKWALGSGNRTGLAAVG